MNPVFDGLINLLSNNSPAISIIFSACALVISVLSYNNSKKETNVLMVKERRNRLAKETAEILVVANETLKDFSKQFYITNIDSIVISVIQLLSSNDKIRLSIKYEKLIINDNVISQNSFNDSKEFVVKVRGILHSLWRAEVQKRSLAKRSVKRTLISYYLRSSRNLYSLSSHEYPGTNVESSISFTTKPEILCINLLKLDNFLFNMVKVEHDIANLTRVQYFIEPYDPDFYDLMEETYESIFKLLYEAFRKQGHEIEFTKNMTPQDISDALYRTMNYEQIIEKMIFMSSNIRKRANKIKREITVQYLTN